MREVNGRALMVLEIKASNIEREVLDVVRKARALDWCAVHSFKSRVVERVRKLEPRMPCTLLTGGRDEVQDWSKVFSLALERGAQGVAPHHSAVTPELVRAANLRELRMSTWTVNSRGGRSQGCEGGCRRTNVGLSGPGAEVGGRLERQHAS